MSTQEIFQGTPRFQILRELGVGGMGVVYEAFDRELALNVALKTLKKLSPQNLYLFKNEFRALANLRHPNLIRLYELISEGGLWFFTMEFLRGEDFLSYVCPEPDATIDELEQLARPTLEATEQLAFAATRAPSDDPEAEAGARATRRPLKLYNEQRLRDAFRQLALGIEALHTAGKVHRDIKPANTLATTEGRVVLMDMGLIAHIGARESALVGTPAYMSPEQSMNEIIGPASDWYSFGVMLYEALTCVLPFDGAYQEILINKSYQDPTPPSVLLSGLPRDLEDLCLALLSRKPELRPSGKEVLSRLGVTRLKHMTMMELANDSAQSGAPFVGRAEEQQTLLRAFLETQNGKPLLVVIEGESGIGKSALAQHFLQPLSQEHGTVILSGRCYEQEQVPYKAFDGVIDSLTRHLLSLKAWEAERFLPDDCAVLAKVFPVLRRIRVIAEEEAPSEDPLRLRHRAFIVLRELLTRLSKHGPLVVFIDDLQWADSDSMALLEELLRPPMAPALLLLATRRSGATLALPGELPLQPITLGNLTEREALDLLEALGGDPRLRDELLREAQGHPLFLQELVRYSAGASGASPQKARLDDIIYSRVLRLEEPSRGLLELLAISGAPSKNQWLRQISALEVGEYRERVDQLRASHLVKTLGAQDADVVELYHNRIGETVRARLAEPTKRAYHLHFVALLEAQEETDPHALVRHLQGAHEERRAIVYAEQAALSARKKLAFEQAAEYYQTALRFASPDDPRRATWQIAKAQAYSNAGRGPEAAASYLEAAQQASPRDRLTYQNQAAEHLLGSGYLAKGKEIVVQVLADIGEALPKTQRRTLLSLLWSRFKIRLHGLRWRAQSEAEVDPKRLLRLDVYKAVSVGVGQIDALQGSNFQAKGLYLALTTGEKRRLARAIALEAIFWSIPGAKHHQRANLLLSKAEGLLPTEPDPYLQGIIDASRGVSLYLRGSFQEAERSLLAAEVLLQDRALGGGWELNNARVYRMFNNLRFRGRFGDERKRFQEYLTDAQRRGDRFMETILSCAFNIMWLANDDPQNAALVLTETLRALPELGSWRSPSFELQPAFWDLWARSHLAMYQQKTDDLPALWEAYERAKGSLLLRSQIARTYHHWIQGGLALTQLQQQLAPKHSLRIVQQKIALLARERVPYISVFQAALEAALHFQQQRPEKAQEALRRVIGLAGAAEIFLVEALARYQLGAMLPTEEGHKMRQEAERFFLEHGIKNPRRMALVYLPGFGAPQQSKPSNLSPSS